MARESVIGGIVTFILGLLIVYVIDRLTRRTERLTRERFRV